MPTKWRVFLCNDTKFQLFEKSFEKTYKNRRFKSHPLRDVFSRAPWQLNDRPKVIRLCDDMSKATPRWDSGTGTISGKTAKRDFWYMLMKLLYRQNKSHYRRKNHWKSTRKATLKRSVIVIPRMTKSKKSEWSLFLNERNRICYNELCRRCVNNCKQSFRAVVISCNYVSKRSVKDSG